MILKIEKGVKSSEKKLIGYYFWQGGEYLAMQQIFFY